VHANTRAGNASRKQSEILCRIVPESDCPLRQGWMRGVFRVPVDRETGHWENGNGYVQSVNQGNDMDSPGTRSRTQPESNGDGRKEDTEMRENQPTGTSLGHGIADAYECGSRSAALEQVDSAVNDGDRRFQAALVAQILFQKPYFERAGYTTGLFITNPCECADLAGDSASAVDPGEYELLGILERINQVAIPGSLGGLTFLVLPTTYMLTLLGEVVEDERGCI